jgi:putative phage-type endonuclease
MSDLGAVMNGSAFASEATVLLRAPYRREDWLKTRTLGVGGSDASVVAGVNPYRSAYALWCEKSGFEDCQNPEPGPESPMYWGHALEDDLDAAFRQVTGLDTVASPGLLRHRERNWQLANPDRIVWQDGSPAGIVEYKTTGARNAHEWADGQIPLAALLQTQHYLAVTGLSRAWVVCLIGGQTFTVRDLERDEALIARLVQIECGFWMCVTSGLPPEPDGTASTAAAIRRQYPEPVSDDAALAFGAEQLVDVETIRALSAQIGALEELREAARQRLQVALGEHALGYDGERLVVRWRKRMAARIDATALAADHPDIAAQYRRPSESRPFILV